MMGIAAVGILIPATSTWVVVAYAVGIVIIPPAMVSGGRERPPPTTVMTRVLSTMRTAVRRTTSRMTTRMLPAVSRPTMTMMVLLRWFHRPIPIKTSIVPPTKTHTLLW